MKFTRMLKPTLTALAAIALTTLGPIQAQGAGVLTPVNANHQPIQIVEHHVNAVLNNGFAQTTIEQTFHNPNPQELEAIYSFPVPESATLADVTIYAGEKVLRGEVLPRQEAETIYEEEKSSGNDAGLASKESYQNFEFRVYPVPAQGQTRMVVTYYQKVELDTGVGRYVYPLEEGGTDEQGESFWTRNDKVECAFSATVTLRTTWPVEDIRVPSFGGNATQLEDGSWQYRYECEGASLNQDFIFYYRLADNLPGRVEMLTYKPDPDQPGTFMMILTPGLDLQPLTQGSDYLFVLDKSGSMQAKIHTLASGVEKALGHLSGNDRFRIITFDNDARELTRGWVNATTENITPEIEKIKNLRPDGSTNLYSGLKKGLQNLDSDRATSLILVTDGVTNTGVIDPARYHQLMKQVDVRLFGFLMGNQSNWPLMRVITESSDGFYTTVSNADDIMGKILQAKEKIVYESLLDADLDIDGVKTFDVTRNFAGRIYRGQQLVLFGRYEDGGEIDLKLKARKTGEDKVYQTRLTLPDVATDYPEIERLWALSRIEEINLLKSIGKQNASEATDAVTDLAVEYQLVTDETAMIVLDDASFNRRGIERRNLQRTTTEQQAQTTRAQAAPANNRVDQNQRMFDLPTPRIGGGGGGGAFGWEALLFLSPLGVLLLRKNKQIK